MLPDLSAWLKHYQHGQSDIWTDRVNPHLFWRGAWRRA